MLWGNRRLAERVQVFRELATLVNSGMALGEALSVLEAQGYSYEMQRALNEASAKVSRGTRLSEIMARHPQIFSELNRALVTAGEEGGRLDDMLRKNAEYLEQEQEFHQMLSQETFYPKILLLAVIFIPLLTNVIITGVTSSGTEAFLSLVRTVMWYSVVVVLPLIALVWVVRRYRATESGQYALDAFVMRIPLIGKIVLRSAWARVSRAYSALYSAGVGMSDTVRLAASTAGNLVIAQSLERTIPHLNRGEPLSQALQRTGQVPSLVMSMLKTGEESGNMDETMLKVADYFEAETKTATRQLAITIVPIAVIIFGIIVLLQAVKFYMGYFGELLN